MIINIYKGGASKPQQYSYTEATSQVVIGRNPKCEEGN